MTDQRGLPFAEPRAYGTGPGPPALTVLSYGAGQDSTALLYLAAFDATFRRRYLPGRFLVLFADTGDEHDHTYVYLNDHIKPFCATHGIEFWHLTPDLGFHSPAWQSLRHFYRTHHAIGSKAYPKTCSDQLKIKPIERALEAWLGRTYGVPVGRKQGYYAFAQQHGPIAMLVGIAQGEERRCADPATLPVWKRRTLRLVYPLLDLGWDRAWCQVYIRAVGQPVPYPSNCRLCPFLTERELLWLKRRHPEDLADWIALERTKLDAHRHLGDKNYGVFGQKPLPMVLLEAERTHGHLSDADLDTIKFSHGHQVATRY